MEVRKTLTSAARYENSTDDERKLSLGFRKNRSLKHHLEFTLEEEMFKK